MTETYADAGRTPIGPPVGAFPAAMATGTTAVLCGFDPTEHAVGLRCLRQFAGPTHEAVVVTTERGVEATVETDSAVGEMTARPSVRVVDMVSKGQSISATYGEIPTVYTPSQGDTERLVLALSELTGQSPAPAHRHLVIRSVSPMLRAAATTRVTDVLERIAGVRTTDGCALFGVDYTRHDTETVRSLSNIADRVLWVSRQSDGSFAMDLRSTRSGHGQFTVEPPTSD